MEPAADDLQEVLKALEPLLASASREGDTRLPAERDLAEQLGVPRRRLRLALNELQQRGKIFRRHGQGTFVAPPPHPDRGRHRMLAGKIALGQLMDVRLQIEPRLAELAAINGTEAEFAQLAILMRKTREAKTPRDYDLADEVFHYRIAELAKNPLFLEIYDLIREMRREAGWRERREETHSPAVISMLVEQHQKILDAISRRDPEAANAEVGNHLRYLARTI
ncbi:FadR/GntR family transcriptional regulator [Paracoccus fistulariae]|uniref:FadR family transcriptional regulator n=1 Tax=Paracoccus fistulariae TaxID=658446 RepID=A0ABY7SM23_9RHOB|nr:FCD domain-containing protein [Paracoccus fistulariae]MDB6179743.1 FCD domain-containing protein [Paracoccus fistulariae]WCR07856.1 FadR family transcriptional regulator [Paracoccus fistulariae]